MSRVDPRALALFAGTGLLYALTAAPDLPPGHDSAELITAACLPGVAHPPSYPLYVMLGYLWSHLPLGSMAHRLNLMAAACVALAVALAFVAFRRATGNAWAALGGALAFALAQTPWRQAVMAEKYSLHLALLAWLLCLSADWPQLSPEARSRRLAWIGLALGFGLAHHQTIVLACPGLAWMLWRDRPSSWRGLAAIALGLLAYAYTFLRALAHPALNWGDPDTLERLLWVVTRSGYGSVALNTEAGSGGGFAQVAHYTHSLLWEQFPLYGLVALAAWKRGRSSTFVAALALDWLLMGPFFALISGQAADEGHFDLLERFYAASYLAWAGLMAVGWSELAFPSGLALAALVGGALHGSSCSLVGQYQAADLEQAIFDHLPHGAIYLPGSDLTAGGALYEQLVLGQRPDVQVLFPGLLGSPWYRSVHPLPEGDLIELCKSWRLSGTEVYFDTVPTDVPGFFVPDGLAYRYLAPGEPIPDRVATERANFDYLVNATRRGNYSFEPTQPFWIHENLGRWGNSFRHIAESLAESDKARARQALDLAGQMAPLPLQDSHLRSLLER